MSKLLKNIIGETYFPKNKDEQDFMKKHVVTRFGNMYSGSEYDKLFGATETKQSPREADRHGYSGSPSPKGIHDEPQAGNDAKVYEDVQLDEVENETLQPHLPTEVEFKHPETGEVRSGTVRHSVHNGGMHTGFEVEDHKTRQPDRAGEMHIVPKGHVRHAPGAVDVTTRSMVATRSPDYPDNPTGI